MAITIQDVAQETKEWYGVTTRQTVDLAIDTPIQILGLVPCRDTFSNGCDDILQCNKVIASNNASEDDRSYFYFDYPKVSSTATFQLEKLVGGSYQTVVADLDNTYGTKVDVGGYQDYPTRASYVIAWNNVYSNFGAGVYRFVVSSNPDLRSYPFRLLFESCTNENETVKIKLTYFGEYPTFNPNLEPSIHDAKSSNDTFNDEIRLRGKFESDFEFETEKNFIELADGRIVQTITRESEIWNMFVSDCTYETIMRLYKYGFNSQNINVTDFDKNQKSEFFKNINVINRDSFEVNNKEALVRANFIPQTTFKLVGDKQTYYNC